MILRIIDSPLPWAIAGVVIGFALGVTTLSSWLVVAGLVGYIVYLAFHRDARESTEGNLVASGPVFMLAWILGFYIKDLV
ncbi:MAG: hypothetical protein F4X72_09725 [Dehalococcoidia bacterium]|nr:hypothetical protein [Dehalococcoidia bacterium]